eukprot:6858532-Heterocapsa_arctica.AAC.1
MGSPARVLLGRNGVPNSGVRRARTQRQGRGRGHSRFLPDRSLGVNTHRRVRPSRVPLHGSGWASVCPPQTGGWLSGGRCRSPCSLSNGADTGPFTARGPCPHDD